jgi:HlyD family secretion protein
MKKYIILGFVGVAIAVGIVIALRGPSVAVVVTKPRPMTVQAYVAEDAKTRLAYEYVVDMPVAGTLERIQLEVGDYVEKGQVIAHVNPYDLRQRIRQGEAQMAQRKAQITGVDVAKPKPEDLDSAKLRVEEMDHGLEISRKAFSVSTLNFEEAKREYERAKGLLEAGAASASYLDEREMRYKGLAEERAQRSIEVERAQQALDQARLAEQRLVGSVDDNEYQREVIQAEMAALEAELGILREDLAKTEIKAPVSGPILEKFVENRRVLAEGQELLRIGDMDSIEIECDVLSEEISAVAPGNKVLIHGKALLGRALEGAVKRIYPSGFKKISALGVEQQRVKALIDFDNSAAQLRPGTSVDIQIVTQEAAGAIAVPDRAVFREGDGWAVFVVERGRARLRSVEVGVRNENWAEIKSGLTTGDTVVAELSNDLKQGVRVLPLS